MRAPASHCGLYGIRPSHGRISLSGVLDLAPSLDTCGYFARDVDTFARVSDVLLGEDPSPLPESIRLLKPVDIWSLLDAEVTPAQAAPLARVEAVFGKATSTQVILDDITTMYWHFRHIQGREAWMVNGPLIERFCPPLGVGIAERFDWSSKVTDAQLAAATHFRTRFKKHLADFLGADGVLVLPTMPDIAPRTDDDGDALESYRNRSIQMLCIAGLSGFPQISMPLGQRLGAPLGLSLLGPAGSDASLVQLAKRISTQAA